MKKKVDQRDRAKRAWDILIDYAESRHTITYGELGSLMTLHYRACGSFLGLIQNYCLTHNLPPLQSLVVKKVTRKPSWGYTATTTDHIEQVHKSVYVFNWKAINNPF